jgi:putative acetyltransferase
MLEIVEAKSGELISQARVLFREYANYIQVDLCFQNFDQELNQLPGEYAPPKGRILIAFYNNELAGCVALRLLEKDICEMKRLYVRPKFRAKKVGRTLAEKIISEAVQIGYSKMRLDTLSSMREAITLYLSLGFRGILPYRYNPLKEAQFFELDLTTQY